jgi:UDP-glucose 4-epimerase
MKAFITGVAGFIGSCLAERLLYMNNDWSVTGIDNFYTGKPYNIKHLLKHPRFKFIDGDIRNPKDFPKDNYNVVFHLAAVVGVKNVVNNLGYTFDVNIKGSENVIDFTMKKAGEIFIFSSSEVYGNSTKEFFTETDDFQIGNNGRWIYAGTKIMDEFMAMVKFKENNLALTICRLFNVTGPKQVSEYGMVVPRFIDQAIKGEDITIFGTGKQTRCFTYIEDVLDAFELLLKNDKEGQVYNVGNDQEISITELAELILQKTNSKSKIIRIPYNQVYNDNFEDMLHRKPNNAKLKSLGWKVNHNIESIIDEILKGKM